MRSNIRGRVVLGIDAAWTASQPSGVALVAETDDGWVLCVVAPSYGVFCSTSESTSVEAVALIAASTGHAGRKPDLVAIDMPLAHSPVTCRRVSDNTVSRAYGARHCSTHTPSAVRPGSISDRLTAGFTNVGYALATERVAGPSLVEVYPHPALVELTGEAVRLPYKVAKLRAYWPGLPPRERRLAVIEVWRRITAALNRNIAGVAERLPLPSPDEGGRVLKAFEDKLDAVVCAWVGICVLEGRAQPFGDANSAIWIPSGGSA
jgi:predicted RNase H-like nuclease